MHYLKCLPFVLALIGVAFISTPANSEDNNISRPILNIRDCTQFASDAADIQASRKRNPGITTEEFHERMSELDKGIQYIQGEELKKEVVKWVYNNFDEPVPPNFVFDGVLQSCKANIYKRPRVEEQEFIL